MKTQRFMKHACLALLLFMSAGVTLTAAEDNPGQKQLDLREGEATWIGQANPHVWDRDGLWVGRLLESPLLSKVAPPEAYGLCGEQFGGSLYTNPKTGEVFFYGAGQNNVPIFRITGWDGWTRQTGAVEITP